MRSSSGSLFISRRVAPFNVHYFNEALASRASALFYDMAAIYFYFNIAE